MWHRIWCHFWERPTVQERNPKGVLGFRCPCVHWEAAITRPPTYAAALPPAHERYAVRRLPKKKDAAKLLKMR